MDVKITLEDVTNLSIVEINNSDEEDRVWITLKYKSNESTELCALVYLEDLKHALRKISHK